MLRITALREAKNISRAELARRSGLNASSISWIETGRFIPYPSQLDKLAAALEYAGDPSELIQEVD